MSLLERWLGRESPLSLSDGHATDSDGTETGIRQARRRLAQGDSLAQALTDGEGPVLGAASLWQLQERLRADTAGAGPCLQPLLERPEVTDVLVGGGQIWIDRGQGVEPVPGPDWEESEIRALAVRMAAACGRRLDDASPVVDATLPDGTRLNAVLPPLSDDGTLICLRTSRRRAFTLDALVDAGTLTPGLARVLDALVQQRANCLITGATGTGKTTLLAALLSAVPADQRIVCIEEASELRPDHPHVIHLQERGANIQGVGVVNMSELVRTALRMRPDRIVLGECRGAEVREMLTALNTGHEGGWATIHANSPADVPARLTALGALAGMSESTVAAQAGSALDAVVHLRRLHGRRQVASIGVIRRENGVLCCRDALRLVGSGIGTGVGAGGKTGQESVNRDGQEVVAAEAMDWLAQRIGREPVAAALKVPTQGAATGRTADTDESGGLA